MAEKLFPLGARRIVSGEVEWFDMRPQIRHPDYVLTPERASEIPTVEPVYRLTAGLSPKVSTRAIGAALDRVPELPEWLSPDIVAARGWPSFAMRFGRRIAPDRCEEAGPTGAGLAAARLR